MASVNFGYVRVSANDQNEARQVEQLKNIGIDDRYIFIDKVSGKDFIREQYKAMCAMLREGDTVYIASLDRLGRNYREILNQWTIITKEKGADIVILDMPILDTRNNHDLTGTLISDIVLQLLSYVAERERINIRERQREGIEIAKKNGVYKGRKPLEYDKYAFAALYEEVKRGERTNKYAMEKLGMKPTTYYKAAKDYKNKTGPFAENN